MCRNDKDCPTSGEMTDAKSGAAKTNTKRKACQRDFSNAMEIVRLLRNHMSKKRMKIGSSTYAKNHRIASIRYYLALFVPVNSISFLVIVCIYRPKSKSTTMVSPDPNPYAYR
jgi:hypothetical protein